MSESMENQEKASVLVIHPNAEWDPAHGCIYDRTGHPPVKLLSGAHWWNDEGEAWKAAYNRLPAPNVSNPKE